MIERNIGTQDRVIRLLLAIIVLVFSWWQSSWIALMVAIFIFYEAAAGWCLFYQLTGKSSCPISKDKK